MSLPGLRRRGGPAAAQAPLRARVPGLGRVTSVTSAVNRVGRSPKLRAALRRAEAVLGVVKPVGWLVLGLGVVALLLGANLHWRELGILGAAGVLVVLLALPMLVGRSRVRIEVTLEPQRVQAGQSVLAGLTVTNLGTARQRPVLLDLPVGAGMYRYDLPPLGAGAVHEESFTIRTERRGVIPVGPAIIRRGDPLGLASRDIEWAGVTEILVRPALQGLESLGAGILRDLEGVSTDAVSQADLAFHALREYVPGDDLRHVHWRSSAKMMASGGTNQLLVRQYLDTRRSHATLVVEDLPAAWGDPEDFETAMEVVGSIVVRAALDEFATSVVCGAHGSVGGDPQQALDTVCRAEPGRTGLLAATQAAARSAGDTSLLFLVGGTGTDFATFARARSVFGPEVAAFAIRVGGGTAGSGEPAASRVTVAGDLPVLHLAKKDDLAGLLRWGLR